MACMTLAAYARQCGKNAKSGVNSDVFLIAFQDLALIAGSTEVFTESGTGLVDEINLKTPLTVKFVKYGTVLNQASIKEDYTAADNGTFDINKEIAFSLTNVGTVEGRKAVEALMGQPVAALVKLQAGQWVAFGLNGQFQLKTVAGVVDATNNGRVLTLGGSDSVLIQTVDPTIIADLIAA